MGSPSCASCSFDLPLVTACHVVAHVALPLVAIQPTQGDRLVLVGCPASGLCGPGLEKRGDVSERPEPVQRSGGRRGACEAGSLVVPQGTQRLDMFVVAPPAPRDRVVVEVGEAALEALDPGSQLLPLAGGVGGRDAPSVRRGGEIGELVVVLVPERVAQLFERVGRCVALIHPLHPLW